MGYLSAISNFNISLFYFFNDFIGRSIIADDLIIFFAKYVVFILLAFAAALIYWDYRYDTKARSKLNLIGLCSSLFAAMVLTWVIHLFYHHLRPLYALGTPHLLTETSYSFPSNHTILIFSLGTGLYFYNKNIAYFFYAAGLLVGIARIAAGVHYPLDIIGGIVFGVGTGLSIELYLREKFRDNRSLSPVSD